MTLLFLKVKKETDIWTLGAEMGKMLFSLAGRNSMCKDGDAGNSVGCYYSTCMDVQVGKDSQKPDHEGPFISRTKT